jgi:hypothetical protein
VAGGDCSSCGFLDRDMIGLWLSRMRQVVIVQIAVFGVVAGGDFSGCGFLSCDRW